MAVGPELKLDFDSLLVALRAEVCARAPAQLALFDTFSAEARFARDWLADSLTGLEPGAPVLEVGAGLMLLACQLCREGYVVTAVEPIGEGFSGFAEVQALVLDFARTRGFSPEVQAMAIETLREDARFVLAYSVNVMEHVGDIEAALAAVATALAPGGHYRFTCPNYSFPYEPHFNIPTLFSKRLTERVFGARIFGNQRMDDPEGVWRSLNWISVGRVRGACEALGEVTPHFRRSLLVKMLARLGQDREFAGRRSRWMRVAGALLVRMGAHRLAGLIPEGIQPIIDCDMIRTGGARAYPIGVKA